MVEVDFTNYKSFSACPVWWRNFVTFAQKDIHGPRTVERHHVLDIEIKKYHGIIVDMDDDNREDIDCLQFETEEDLNAFKLYWTLYGS